MLNIKILPEIASRFRELLDEEGEDAVIRIRETKVGGGWKSRIVLRVSIDEREDPDEEVEVSLDGIPVVISNEIIDSYGNEYEFYIDEHDMTSVRYPEKDAWRLRARQALIFPNQEKRLLQNLYKLYKIYVKKWDKRLALIQKIGSCICFR